MRCARNRSFKIDYTFSAVHLLIALFATLVSAIGSLAGFGGGVFIVPALVMILKTPIEVAIGVTALSLLPSSFLTSWFNLKAGNLNLKLLGLIVLPLIIGAPIGAMVTQSLDAKPLQMIFALFLLLLSTKFLSRSKLNKATDHKVTTNTWISFVMKLPPLLKTETSLLSIPLVLMLSLFSGFLAGLLGIGGGVLVTPILIFIARVSVRTATATAVCSVLFTSLSSGVSHFHLGHFDYYVFCHTAIGFTAGAVIAKKLSLKINDQILLKTIGFSLVACATALLVNLATG